MAEFFLTRMGNKFFESSVPRIAEALERIAKAVEKQNELKEEEIQHTVPT